MSIRGKATSHHGRLSFILGAVSTGLFYFLIFNTPLKHSMLHMYTTEHITEYAITGLFFWTNADLLLSFLQMRRQKKAAGHRWLPAPGAPEPVGNAIVLAAHLDSAPLAYQNTMIARRLDAALQFIDHRRSTEGFREYLDSLAERDADEVFSRYAFPRFVVTMLPILGLLGTVVHFGTALGGLSVDGLTERVPEILSGMGTAFNTTCAALSASTSTMLIRFVVERNEEGIVKSINRYVEDNILHRFRAEAVEEVDEQPAILPMTAGRKKAVRPAVDLSELMVWLDNREQRWQETQAAQMAAIESAIEALKNGSSRAA
ncbi:MAG: MotA/TolQ/ExbB proton channel family protein [Pirellulales bacterium]